jgi:hypothetical protein|tara:strand:+ start:1989 stop:3146 length:1158 start_codon:yes stop_codon:yes gene_type:complete
MEMIDVLKRLQEIANKSPEVQKAISSTEAMNPKQQAAIAIAKKEKNEAHGGQHTTTGRSMTSGEMDKREKIVKGMKKDKAGFKKRYGKDADAVMYATATKQAMKDDEMQEKVGGMSDVFIGAEEAIGDYVDDDGVLKMPKQDVVRDLVKRSKEAPFPKSYELETAAKMVADKFGDDGEEKYMGDDTLNTNTMETKDKKEVKEAIQITTDSPEEAGMMMQILKLAGVKPMGADMPDMKPDMEPKHDMDHGDDDAMMSMDMGRMRDMVMKPDMEKQEETFANSPGDRPKAEPTVQDIDSLVNVHSGGLNRQKTQYRKEYPGDNPMAVAQEDKITEAELSNSLRTQYESFKKAYTEAAKPDYIDLDKDGNKTEPMKKAAKDKEAKDKK